MTFRISQFLPDRKANKIILNILWCYLFLTVSFYILFPLQSPPLSSFCIQIGIAFFTILAIYYSSEKVKLISVLLSIFFFQLIFVSFERLNYILLYNNPLGASPADAALYDFFATNYRDSDWHTIWQSMSFYNLDSADLGFISIIICIYKIFTPGLGISVLLVVNVIVSVLSCLFLYKILKRFVNIRIAYLFVFLWGFSAFSIYTSCSGLKENFFTFCVIFSAYYFIQYEIFRRFSFLLLYLLGASSIFLFRTALGYAAFSPLICLFIFRFKFVRRNFKSVLLLATFATFLLFPILANYILNSVGSNLDRMTEGTSILMERSGPLALISNYFFAFFGSYPSLISTQDKLSYITLPSLSAFIKAFISFFYLLAFKKIIQDKNYVLLSLTTFLVANVVMLVLTFNTLNDRFHWPTMPIVYILSAIGLDYYIRTPSLKKYWSFYFFVSLILIVFFNLRVL